MAQVIDRIVRSKYPPRDTRVLWLDANDNAIKSFINGKWENTARALLSEMMIETTYAELKEARDNRKLIPGQQYRITDYECTTSQEDIKSAGHKFDIIVTADDEETLNEDARAIATEENFLDGSYFVDDGDHCVYLGERIVDGVKVYFWKPISGYDDDTVGYYSQLPIEELMKLSKEELLQTYFIWKVPDDPIIWRNTFADMGFSSYKIYPYFASSNLSAWKLKYCLDNDTTRFTWADVENGKGVIYYMKDEWNNECPYDFKNIQYNGSWGYWAYTFNWINDDSDNTCEDLSVAQYAHTNDEGGYSHTYSNIIKPCETGYGEDYGFPLRLNACVFLNTESHDGGMYSGCYSNIFGIKCYNNTFGNECTENTFGDSCSSNTIGDNCFFNSFGNDCSGNIFGTYCHHNIFGNNCSDNTFGERCSANALDSNCYNNTFGNEFSYNIFGNDCTGNTFGDNCAYSTFGNNCQYIKFASDKYYASAKYTFYRNNHFGDGCQHILFKGAETASYYAQVQNYNFAQGLKGTEAAYLTIDGVRNRAYETKVAKNSNGELKIYCEADLVQ